MNRLTKRLRPSRKCQNAHEAWGPHEGCREFMDEPEVIPCGGRAVREVRVLEAWQEGRSFLSLHVCADCAAELSKQYAGSYGVEAVLVRPLAGAR